MTGWNVHATAVVIGTTGYLFVGPSGTGKTSSALSCIASARRRGWNAALIADDQVLLSLHAGQLIARTPKAIAGLAELRGHGTIRFGNVPSAVMSLAVRPVLPPFKDRVAPADEDYATGPARLSLLRLPLLAGMDPLDALERFSSRKCGETCTDFAQAEAGRGFLTCTPAFPRQDGRPEVDEIVALRDGIDIVRPGS